MFMNDSPSHRSKFQWFSGKIERCHRSAPSSILGWSITFLLFRMHRQLFCSISSAGAVPSCWEHHQIIVVVVVVVILFFWRYS